MLYACKSHGLRDVAAKCSVTLLKYPEVRRLLRSTLLPSSTSRPTRRDLSDLPTYPPLPTSPTSPI